MKDPISDSKSKLAMLKEHCDGVVIKELDAGKQTVQVLVSRFSFPKVKAMVCQILMSLLVLEF